MSEHLQVRVKIKGKEVLIDKECVDLVAFFNSIGLTTKHSCQGGAYNNFIIIFNDNVSDEDIKNFQQRYLNEFGHSAGLGKFQKWGRYMSNIFVYNWIYTADKLEYAKRDYFLFKEGIE